MKKLAILVAAAFMLTATSAFAAPTKKDVGAAVQAAVKAIESAKTVRSEWRHSYKILGKAKKAYRKGNMAKAMKLANQAERQGHAAHAQGMAEMHAGPGKNVR